MTPANVRARRPSGTELPVARATGALSVVLLIGAALSAGCYAPQLLLVRSGLDSLRAVVDTLVVRNEVQYRVLLETRQDVAQQRDILLSTRATTGSTTQELFDQMSRLQGRLDEVLGRFQSISERVPAAAPGPVAPAGTAADPTQLYDQATQDLTQGRWALALNGYRDFLRRFPTAELADNAQYGVGECFFAQAQFDSAATEYTRVNVDFPKGDRVPAALYKLALSQERLGRNAESKTTLRDLIKRFPASGEAQLARDRLGAPAGR